MLASVCVCVCIRSFVVSCQNVPVQKLLFNYLCAWLACGSAACFTKKNTTNTNANVNDFATTDYFFTYVCVCEQRCYIVIFVLLHILNRGNRMCVESTETETNKKKKITLSVKSNRFLPLRHPNIKWTQTHTKLLWNNNSHKTKIKFNSINKKNIL